jgi:hypothetical protein
LAGELAHAGGLIGAVHADVQSGEPDRLARAAHPARVPELGQEGQGDQLPDSELGHQRLAAGLAARDLPKPTFDLADLTLEG